MLAILGTLVRSAAPDGNRLSYREDLNPWIGVLPLLSWREQEWIEMASELWPPLFGNACTMYSIIRSTPHRDARHSAAHFFVQEFEPRRPEPEPEEVGEIEKMLAKLEALEKEHGTRS